MAFRRSQRGTSWTGPTASNCGVTVLPSPDTIDTRVDPVDDGLNVNVVIHRRLDDIIDQSDDDDDDGIAAAAADVMNSNSTINDDDGGSRNDDGDADGHGIARRSHSDFELNARTQVDCSLLPNDGSRHIKRDVVRSPSLTNSSQITDYSWALQQRSRTLSVPVHDKLHNKLRSNAVSFNFHH